MEITCDRLGLAAVKDFNIAAKAILKIVSGITDKYLTNNFDIFLDQLKELKNIGLQDDKYQTHNNWLLRLQALKLFSHSSEYCEYLSQDSRNRKSLDEIDSIISSGIDRFVGYKFDLLFSDESDRIFIWLSAYLILKNSTQHQLVLDEKLSKISKPATIKKLINYITSSDDASIKKKLYEQSLTLEVVPVMIKNNIFDKICEFVSQFHEINDTEITLIKKILNV